MFPLHYFLICEPLCRVPRDINPISFAKNATTGGESQKVDKPRRPQAEKTAPDNLKPPSPKDMQHSSHTGGALPSPTCAASGHNPTGASTGPEPAESPKHLHQDTSPMDSGLLVGTKLARAHPCLNLKSCRSSIHKL
jgi:hypothetical protein